MVIWNPSGDDEKSGHEPCLLMNREFRYPTGQYLLSVPAGLIDPEDVEMVIHDGGISPVSYTHLDVYKRQHSCHT